MTAVLPARRLVDAPPAPDWAEFYRGWQTRGAVPGSSFTVINANHAVFQAMYLDLSEIKLALLSSGFDPPLVTIIADVLNVPADLSWSLNSEVLQIQARRLQTETEFRVNLDFRTSVTTSLVLYCAELDGSARVAAVLKDAPPVGFVIDAPNPSGGTQVGLTDGTPTRTAISWAQGVPTELPTWFEQSMRTEFLFGSLLYDAHPDLAISQFAWLKNWTGYNKRVQGVFLQSSSLLALLTAQVNATSNGTAFVPYLTRSVYGDLARAYVDEAKQYESDYRALQTQQVVDDQFIALAKSLLSNKTYESDYATQLLAQAKRNFDNAVGAADQAARTLATAQLQAKLIAIDFEEVGVPEWRREQIVKAIIEIGSAVVTFAVGIGAMFVGDPAAGGAAVTGAIEGAKAAEKAAEAGSAVAAQAKQLAETMAKLKKVAEAMAKVYELAKTVMKVVGDLDHADSYAAKMRELGAETSGADLTATYEWQVYQQTSDASLKGPIDAGIRYAADLKLAVDAIAVYGQALAAAQVAAIEAGQRYAAVSLQKQLAQRQEAELQAYVDGLQKGAAAPAALLQRFYELYLNAKAGLFAAAQGYRGSYFYWALRPSSINPSIVDGVDGLDTGLRNLTSIALDNEAALEHFDPPPQQLVDKQFSVSDPRVLAQLAAGGPARWVLPAQAREFAGFDRVRLTRVRVWLEGAKLPEGGSVDVRMSTQGNYLDRFAGKPYQFTSKPLVRDFQYRVTGKKVGTPDWRFPDGSFGYIEVDGVVDDEVSYAYFQPTPFAEWSIRVSGDGLNLSGATRLIMQFAGSVIPQT
ncbi:MAG TPA: hypothetical protein VIT20_00960 [Propionibacteriaceae bacterium]